MSAKIQLLFLSILILFFGCSKVSEEITYLAKEYYCAVPGSTTNLRLEKSGDYTLRCSVVNGMGEVFVTHEESGRWTYDGTYVILHADSKSSEESFARLIGNLVPLKERDGSYYLESVGKNRDGHAFFTFLPGVTTPPSLPDLPKEERG